MSWMQSLCRLYDKLEPRIADDLTNTELLVSPKGVDMLIPYAWSSAIADKEITIDAKGNFVRAEKIPERQKKSKKNTDTRNYRQTLIPVTIESGNRTSGAVAHPLFDKLPYVSSDFYKVFPEYFDEKKAKSYQEENIKYVENLKEWAESEYSNEKINAVYKYITKGRVTKDLLKAGVITDDKDSAKEVSANIIRFRVITDDGLANIWQDIDVITSWQKFYLKKLENTLEKKLDFISGEEALITPNATSKIRSYSDSAKIVSFNAANDEPVRLVGKFLKAENTVSCGYVSSEKVMHTLRYLITHQGTSNGSECIVCWSDDGTEIPREFVVPMSQMDATNIMDVDFDEIDIDTGEDYAERLQKAINGYRQKVDDTANIHVLSVDTANGDYKGRLAVTYSNMMSASDFFSNVEKWFSTCYGDMRVHDGEKSRIIVSTPTPLEIVRFAYGIERDNIIDVTNSKELKYELRKLWPCISAGRKLPKETTNNLYRRASSREKYKSRWNDLIRVAYIVIRKEKYDNGLREVDMQEKNRDYLFGELMMLMEKAEGDYLAKKQIARKTNISRKWSAVVANPAKMISLMREKLNKYINTYYDMEIEKIVCELSENGWYTNNRLGKDYILGYYDRRKTLYTKKEATA